jgi:hypothetical protein
MAAAVVTVALAALCAAAVALSPTNYSASVFWDGRVYNAPYDVPLDGVPPLFWIQSQIATDTSECFYGLAIGQVSRLPLSFSHLFLPWKWDGGAGTWLTLGACAAQVVNGSRMPLVSRQGLDPRFHSPTQVRAPAQLARIEAGGGDLVWSSQNDVARLVLPPPRCTRPPADAASLRRCCPWSRWYHRRCVCASVARLAPPPLAQRRQDRS